MLNSSISYQSDQNVAKIFNVWQQFAIWIHFPWSLYHYTRQLTKTVRIYRLCFADFHYQIHYESDGKRKDVHLTEWKLNHVFLCALNLSHFTHDSTAFGSRVVMAIHRSAPNAMVSMCEAFMRNESASGLISFSPALHNCSIAIFFRFQK